MYIDWFGGIIFNYNVLVVKGRYLVEYCKFRLIIKYKHKVLVVSNGIVIHSNLSNCI